MLIIPIHAVFLFNFFYCFSPFFFFFGTPKTTRATWTDLTPFQQPSLFFLCDGESQRQNKAKITYARVII